jgi:hypothetical protein
VANAGRDTVIVLPVDSVLLDGSASSDVDGTITTYRWKSISASGSVYLTNASKMIGMAGRLEAGDYLFELMVTDDGGLSAKDTVRIIVNDIRLQNRTPVANAGPDQTITLPVNIVALDGTASSDPDNNITGYTWTKIEGPFSFTLTNASTGKAELTNLVPGTYLFELKVTDAGGLFSKDTVQIMVNTSTIAGCNNSNRSKVYARLIPFGTLSQPGKYMSVGAAGSKIVFCGRSSYGPSLSSRVDIYDLISQSWSTAELSVARALISVVAAGNKIFFAGGRTTASALNTVDIYDVYTGTWSTSALSVAGQLISSATLGNKVFFAGGDGANSPLVRSRIVDIYDLTTRTWSTAPLSESKNYVSAVTANNKLYFAGGENSGLIDIYDNATNSWSTSQMQEGKMGYAAVSVSNKIYWAGGVYNARESCTVEIRDVVTGSTSIQYLSKPLSWWNNTGRDAVVKDNKIIFFRGSEAGKEFDIYDIASNSWSIGVFPFTVEGACIISVNNTVYLAGGVIDGSETNLVWTLDF